MQTITSTPDAVLDFWFTELTHDERFGGGERVDQLIADRFSLVHQAVRQGECAKWRSVPRGALAEIIVLDQFSRNLFRGEAEAFANDDMALVLAQEAIARGDDAEVRAEERLFFYLPYMHSESPVIHETALELFTALGNDEALQYERIHKDIIDRFGRYPHRNKQLGRASTAEEEAYLKDTDHAFFKS